jgi:gentisate 1,2-dioxygenase
MFPSRKCRQSKIALESVFNNAFLKPAELASASSPVITYIFARNSRFLRRVATPEREQPMPGTTISFAR